MGREIQTPRSTNGPRNPPPTPPSKSSELGTIKISIYRVRKCNVTSVWIPGKLNAIKVPAGELSHHGAITWYVHFSRGSQDIHSPFPVAVTISFRRSQVQSRITSSVVFQRTRLLRFAASRLRTGPQTTCGRWVSCQLSYLSRSCRCQQGRRQGER